MFDFQHDEYFLEDAVCFNTVRNMFGYTGNYKGQKISVWGGAIQSSTGIFFLYQNVNF